MDVVELVVGVLTISKDYRLSTLVQLKIAFPVMCISIWDTRDWLETTAEYVKKLIEALLRRRPGKSCVMLRKPVQEQECK